MGSLGHEGGGEPVLGSDAKLEDFRGHCPPMHKLNGVVMC